ncbi:MAG: alpha/beta hydrolase [Chloroflexi bacterium]|nr:alpha/beta hydrolase [Chloroflexota bacterium]
MPDWTGYAAYYADDGHTVTGDVLVCPDVYSPQLDNIRDILVYLPPSYHHSTRSYPVLYMHDGQNLFDERTSFVGEWEADETLDALSDDGIEAIVVGIPNMGDYRLDEYGPRHNPVLNMGGQGEAYLAFVCDTLKPLIDSHFRTRPTREHTGIMGSSMGGLISVYAYSRYSAVFGLCGAMSPAFWFSGEQIFDFVAHGPLPPGRMYIDVGTQEIPRPGSRDVLLGLSSARYVADARRMRDLLYARGFEDLRYVEEEDAIHHESAWARRLPAALRFLLG